MSIQQLNVQAKTAISLFLLFIVTATISAVILLGLGLTGEDKGFKVPTITQIKNHYATPEIVGAMRGSMYKEVTEDSDIDIIERWIRSGAKKEDKLYEDVEYIIKNDCADCHSRTSTMTKAIPSMPFETYEDIKSHTEIGYSWLKMSKQAHIHMFGISMFLIVITLIFAYTTYKPFIKMTFIIASFGGAFLDIFSWWFSKYEPDLVYMIYAMGGVMITSILLMSVMILVDMWKK